LQSLQANAAFPKNYREVLVFSNIYVPLPPVLQKPETSC
jgi:hypothetical protein